MNIARITPTYTSNLQKISCILLIVGPILNIYGWPSLSFALILNIILIAIYFIKRPNRSNKLWTNKTPSILILYFGYWLFTNIIHAQSLNDLLSLGILTTSLAIIVTFELFKFDYFLKVYRIVAYVAIGFFVFQLFVLNISGVLVKGVTNYLPISFHDDITTWYESNENGMRPSSFFSEPAHMAQFLLPLLCIELFSIYKNGKRALFIIVIIILLKAGNGYTGLGVIGIVYTVSIFRSTESYSKRIESVFLVAVSILGSSYFFNSENGTKVLERADTVFDYKNLNAGWDGASSAFVRIYRGFYVFDKFSFDQKILGIGNNQSQLFEAQKATSISFLFRDGDNYMSGLQNILIKTGIIGLIMFMILVVRLWNVSDFLGKSLLSVMGVIMCIASIYFTQLMLMCLVIPWYYYKVRSEHS